MKEFLAQCYPYKEVDAQTLVAFLSRSRQQLEIEYGVTFLRCQTRSWSMVAVSFRSGRKHRIRIIHVHEVENEVKDLVELGEREEPVSKPEWRMRLDENVKPQSRQKPRCHRKSSWFRARDRRVRERRLQEQDRRRSAAA